MQDYTNNPFVGSKVIQELKIGTRKNMQYDPIQSPVQLIQQLENMDYLAYDIVERLKDKEPVVRQILKEQNDIDYLMDMHQEYYTNENKRENSLVYKLQNQYLSDIETQRIISNIPLCPGNIVELDTNEHHMLQLSPVMYLVSVNWGTTNQNTVKEYFNRWVPIVPYNANLYVAMYSPNTFKIQEHQKQFLNVYNHRYIHNYKYAYILKQLPQTKVYLTYNGQLYKLAKEQNAQNVLSKLVKDFTDVPDDMIPIEDYHQKVYSLLGQMLVEQLNEFFSNCDQQRMQINDKLQKIVSITQSLFNNLVYENILQKDQTLNKKYKIINSEEVCSELFNVVDVFVQNLPKINYTQVDQRNLDMNQHVCRIVDTLLGVVQFDFDYRLLDAQKEYFYTNQDYMFCIKQYQFTNQEGDVFRIVAPMNNIVSNVYVYSVVGK